MANVSAFEFQHSTLVGLRVPKFSKTSFIFEFPTTHGRLIRSLSSFL